MVEPVEPATRLSRMSDTSAGPRLLGPTEVRRLAAELDLRPTKQRGQNFVIAANTLRARLGDLGVEPRPVLLVSNIYCADALSRLARKLVFYDFNDSPFQFDGVPDWARDCWRRMRSRAPRRCSTRPR